MRRKPHRLYLCHAEEASCPIISPVDDVRYMTTDVVDIATNRSVRKYSRSEMMRRVLWMLTRPLFRFSPRPLFGWRRFLLRLFGAEVGKGVHLYNTAIVYMPWNLRIGALSAVGEGVLIYNLGPVTIGERVTVSQRAHLCAGTHDYTDPCMPLLKPPITVEDQAWVCADAFVGPDVRIGEGAVVGGRAVVMSDVEPWAVVAGNPARFIKHRKMNV